MSEFRRHHWVKFNQAMVIVICLASYIAQLFCWRQAYYYGRSDLFHPIWPAVAFGGLLIIIRPINQLLSKTSFGARVAVMSERGRLASGALVGLTLSLIALAPAAAGVFNQVLDKDWMGLISVVGLAIGVVIFTMRIDGRPIQGWPWASVSKENAAKPLYVSSFFDWSFPDQAGPDAGSPVILARKVAERSGDYRPAQSL